MGGTPSATDDRAAVPSPARVSRSQEEAILSALGDPQSRGILLNLNEGPRSALELTKTCDLPQASVYRKLRELQEAGLVGIQRTVLTDDGHRTDLYRSLLVAATLSYRGASLEVRASYRELAAERLGDLWDAVRSGGRS